MTIEVDDGHDEYRMLFTGTEAECQRAMERAPTVVQDGMSVSRASIDMVPLSQWNRTKPQLTLGSK